MISALIVLVLAGPAAAQGGSSARVPALVRAAQKSDVATVQRLLARPDTDINVKNADGKTALMIAAQNGNAPLARLLLAHGAKVDARRLGAETALCLAADAKHADVVALLLARGANPEVRFGKGQTPLMAAAEHRDRKTVEVLLRHGANVNARNNWQMTALMYAASAPAFYVASAEPSADLLGTVQLLLDAGADVNAVGYGEAEGTVFVYAAGGNSVALVRMLLAHGANVTATDVNRRTALWYARSATSANRDAIIALLKSAGTPE